MAAVVSVCISHEIRMNFACNFARKTPCFRIKTHIIGFLYIYIYRCIYNSIYIYVADKCLICFQHFVLVVMGSPAGYSLFSRLLFGSSCYAVKAVRCTLHTVHIVRCTVLLRGLCFPSTLQPQWRGTFSANTTLHLPVSTFHWTNICYGSK